MFHVEHRQTNSLTALLLQSAAELCISLPSASVPQFMIYLEELRNWNKSINLTAIEDDREIVIKHFVDSLAITRWVELPSGASLLDIGSGAGFPGMPIKLVRPDLSVGFLEPNEKKAAFLRFVIGKLRLSNATVIPSKLDAFDPTNRVYQQYDCLTVRALRVETIGLSISNLLKPDGIAVLYRASRAEESFSLNGLALDREVEYELPSGLGHRVLSIFSRSQT